MSTTTVPIAITCPDWCTDTPDAHAADLWNMGGNCIHRSPAFVAEDRVGYSEALTEPRFNSSVLVDFSTSTSPEGEMTASAVLNIHGHTQDMSMAQALELAQALHDAVELYKAAGGRVDL